MRAGGSQIGCPNGGDVNGQYGPRWTFERAYYDRALRTGAHIEVILAANVRWDLWNEPIIFFWGRSQAQYLEMARRGTLALRAAFGAEQQPGPSARHIARLERCNCDGQTLLGAPFAGRLRRQGRRRDRGDRHPVHKCPVNWSNANDAYAITLSA